MLVLYLYLLFEFGYYLYCHQGIVSAATVCGGTDCLATLLCPAPLPP